MAAGAFMNLSFVLTSQACRWAAVSTVSPTTHIAQHFAFTFSIARPPGNFLANKEGSADSPFLCWLAQAVALQ